MSGSLLDTENTAVSNEHGGGGPLETGHKHWGNIERTKYLTQGHTVRDTGVGYMHIFTYTCPLS